MVATTQLGLALETVDAKRPKKWIGFDLDLIWIEVGVFTSGMSSLAL